MTAAGFVIGSGLLCAPVVSGASRAPALAAAATVVAGAVLGALGSDPRRSHRWRWVLCWSGVAAATAAWWLVLLVLTGGGPLELYTLPVACLAALVGRLEVGYRPTATSWAIWAPALLAALGPSLAAAVATASTEPARLTIVLLGGVAALVAGAAYRLQAPYAIGGVVTAIALIWLLLLLFSWAVVVPLGLLLVVVLWRRWRHLRLTPR